MFNDIYKNKKVLIFGNTGFKGSWLTLWLTTLNANVFGYSHKMYPHYELLNLNNKVKTYFYDVRNLEKVKEVIKEVKPDIIFDLHAQPIVSLSYSDPVETYEINVIGTLNILEAIRTCHQPYISLFITTDKVYLDQGHLSYRESDELGGYDLYACSKVCIENIVNSYKKSFLDDILIATCRSGNCIGGGDWGVDRLIPDMMRAFSKKEKFKLRNPHYVRPWSYILDTLSGYLMLGEKLFQKGNEYEGAWNFGPDVSSYIPTYEIVNQSINYWSDLKSIQKNDYLGYDIQKSVFHETKILMIDSTKARILLGWSPKFDIGDTIIETMYWYKQFYTNNKIITLDQISEYNKR